MSIESAVEQSTATLTGDLHSLPKPERRLFNSDTYGLEWAIPHAGSEAHTLHDLIRRRQELLRSELANCDLLLDAVLLNGLGPQFRSRPDYERGQVAVEQWVPALDCWMVNGYFPPSSTPRHILDVLLQGDPRRKTAEEELEDRRNQAVKVQKSNDQRATDRLLNVLDSMSSRQVEQFVEVEQAIHTGESITTHGSDYHTIELLESDTRKAAALGDREAQAVLTRGQHDNPTCILPTTNPLRHRHRTELEKEAAHVS